MDMKNFRMRNDKKCLAQFGKGSKVDKFLLFPFSPQLVHAPALLPWSEDRTEGGILLRRILRQIYRLYRKQGSTKVEARREVEVYMSELSARVASAGFAAIKRALAPSIHRDE